MLQNDFSSHFVRVSEYLYSNIILIRVEKEEEKGSPRRVFFMVSTNLGAVITLVRKTSGYIEKTLLFYILYLLAITF